MNDDLLAVREAIDESFELAIARLCDFLRIPSVSAAPDKREEVRAAGRWLVDALEELGFTADLYETPGHPVVWAHRPAQGRGPALLYYGHYDVQPADPLDLWHSPPFEPTIVEGPHGPRLVARGAVDDKGQLIAIVESLRAWLSVHGDLPLPVTFIVEGEEEIGSPHLASFLASRKDEIKAAVAIISDTNAWDIDTPAITTSLRGLLYLDIKLHGADRDLHSGLYGGAVANPINVLASGLARLVGDNGRVGVPGFYDDVAEIEETQREAWKDLEFDERQFLAEVGLPSASGKDADSVLEKLWSRPTLDINGIRGGYAGPGAKTVIPAMASAKLSCRLVPNQQPDKIAAAIAAALNAFCPPGFRYEIDVLSRSPAFRVSTDNNYLEAARRALSDVFDREAALIGVGGSIPVVGDFKTIFGIDSILAGFGLPDDRTHSANEKFELRCLRSAMHAHASILARMAELGPDEGQFTIGGEPAARDEAHDPSCSIPHRGTGAAAGASPE